MQFACYKLNFRGFIGKMLLDFLHESPHVEKMWHVMCRNMLYRFSFQLIFITDKINIINFCYFMNLCFITFRCIISSLESIELESELYMNDIY